MIDFTTPRLRIRDYLSSDLEGWHRLWSDTQNLRFVESMQSHSFEKSRAELAKAIDAARESPRVGWFFAVELTQTGEYIGDVGFSKEPKEGGTQGGVGWFFLPEYQGKGYATEAFLALIPRMFNDWGVDIIHAGCNAANRASERVMQKGGLRLVKCEAQRLQYQLTKEDWEKQRQS